MGLSSGISIWGKCVGIVMEYGVGVYVVLSLLHDKNNRVIAIIQNDILMLKGLRRSKS
tara:strand:- start:86 stop:259 length:174 start_codon:yes stop_codon:yes gene_type:complete